MSGDRSAEAASGAGGGAGLVAPLPADAADVLRRVDPFQRRIFARVRHILDRLEASAPWASLYDPSDHASEPLAMEQRLLDTVAAIPSDLAVLLAALRDESARDARPALEEAELYFTGICRMVERDVVRLRDQLAAAREWLASGSELPLAGRAFLCEVAADLKGKYASALMGATASIVARGRWSGVWVEPVLFGEKADEFRRNGILAASLDEVIAALGRLREEQCLPQLVDSWRSGRRADLYAPAELAALRGALARLLQRSNRRALYSGDFHQIQRREARLSQRALELEALHLATWAEGEVTGPAPFARLAALALEIAAILDVELLTQLIGSRAVGDLRAAVVRERSRPGERQGRRRRVPEERLSLLPLLADDDLRSFLELLRGAVRQRASFSLVPAASAEPAERATAIPMPAPLAAAGEEGPIPAPPPPRAASPASAGTSAVPAAEQRRALEDLQRLLRRLRAADNPEWRSLQMLQRLLGKRTRVPPSMLAASHPYFFVVLDSRVPRLEVVESFGGVPAEVRPKLVSCCEQLCSPTLTPEQMGQEVPANL
ncbi:MAG TPA: hypothetical protein VMT16_16340, partial [Thermoanaerobaculia bacterium]|nr:hypothetical protein [Thermoanaerobaculia bacterium]